MIIIVVNFFKSYNQKNEFCVQNEWRVVHNFSTVYFPSNGISIYQYEVNQHVWLTVSPWYSVLLIKRE